MSDSNKESQKCCHVINQDIRTGLFKFNNSILTIEEVAMLADLLCGDLITIFGDVESLNQIDSKRKVRTTKAKCVDFNAAK